MEKHIKLTRISEGFENVSIRLDPKKFALIVSLDVPYNIDEIGQKPPKGAETWIRSVTGDTIFVKETLADIINMSSDYYS